MAEKYWKLVRLEATGKTKVQEIILAREFIEKQFPELNSQIINDTIIQRQLLKFLDQDTNNHFIAQSCLRCFISFHIEQACIQLEFQFGKEYDFNRYDLFPFVLNDTLEDLRNINLRRTNQSKYKPLSIQILETFDLQKANLSTWTTRIVKQNRELNSFLLEHGLYLISSWAILNDTTFEQVGRILSEFHHFTSAEIEQASFLLSSYHAIYRQDRLKQRTNLKGKCQPPSLEQLERIAYILKEKTDLVFSPDNVLDQLQKLAQLLRQYRIHVRSGKFFAQQSLDNHQRNRDKIQQYIIQTESEDESEQKEFSQFYRQEFLSCLKESIEFVIKSRVSHLNRKSPLKTQQFLTALELFHCQGKSMEEIAPLVNLKAQYQVTRLLKLKEFRADVRQNMLQQLRNRTLTIASQYTDINQLQHLEHKIETALDEQIGKIIRAAEVEATIANNSSPNSLFTNYLCQYLN